MTTPACSNWLMMTGIEISLVKYLEVTQKKNTHTNSRIGRSGMNIKLDPVPRVNSCPRGFCCCVKLNSSYQVSKIAEIFWVNRQGALEKQLDPGR